MVREGLSVRPSSQWFWRSRECGPKGNPFLYLANGVTGWRIAKATAVSCVASGTA